MYCQNCGADLPDGSKFCNECGARLEAIYSPEISPTSKKRVKSKSKKKKWWIWLILGLIIVMAISNSGNNDGGGSKSSNVNSSAPKPTSTPKPTATLTPTAPPVPSYLLGDSVSYDGLVFTAKSIVFSNYAGNLNGLNKSDSDYVYCVIYFDVANTTNEKKTLVSPFLLSYMSDYSFTLLYDGDVQYTESFVDKYSDFLFSNEEILPLATLTNKVLNFKVPVLIQSSDKPLDLVFSVNSEQKAVWRLR